LYDIKNLDRSFFHFVTNHAFDRRTDGQTDRQTDRETDRQTEFSSLDGVCIPCSAVIINNYNNTARNCIRL